ncbi:response regulator [bacterium]|nr:response regulator [bacterium]
MKHKILIVDDNKLNQKIIIEILKEDFTLETADDGEKALGIIQEFRPSIILLDIMMPGIDGYEVCKRVKQNTEYSNIKILLVSAKTTVEDRLRGYEVGADDYIVKPFDEDELFAKVSVFGRLVEEEEKRKEYEKKIQVANEEMQALSATGALVATVAHDAKKFTAAMSMSLEGLIIPPLRDNLVQSDLWVMDLMNDLIEVYTNSKQCTNFLESLLAINRKDERIEAISAVEILQQAFGLLSYNLMQEKIDWKLKFESGRKMMVMGNNQLIRVFMNLIANASDALMKYETEIPTITAEITDIGSEIQISIHDNGPGIKPEILQSIRKGMVISTKGKGGNGFGVSGATKIVKNCGGSMRIESELGKGATFIVTLEKTEEKIEENVDLDGIDLF